MIIMAFLVHTLKVKWSFYRVCKSAFHQFVSLKPGQLADIPEAGFLGGVVYPHEQPFMAQYSFPHIFTMVFSKL